MKKNKTNLDEMQEQKLLEIEHGMAWLAFWALLVAIVIQLFLFGPGEIRAILGEWIVFIVMCVYLIAGCTKNGIWSRTLKPDRRTNFLGSLVGAVSAGAVVGALVYRSFGILKAALIAFGGVGGITLVCCYGMLTLAAKAYKKRLEETENACEGEVR